jgi:hypothetical protein
MRTWYLEGSPKKGYTARCRVEQKGTIGDLWHEVYAGESFLGVDYGQLYDGAIVDEPAKGKGTLRRR